MKLIVIVDMQNDFISGPLGSNEALNAKHHLIEYLSRQNLDSTAVVFTRDTHYENYLETAEGKKLPVPHCIIDTDGWQIDEDIVKLVVEKNFFTPEETNDACAFDKTTFGSIELASFIHQAFLFEEIDEVIFTGVCTDICVISNVLLAKAYAPEIPISIIANCCAGTTPVAHEAALMAMKSCQIDIIYE